MGYSEQSSFLPQHLSNSICIVSPQFVSPYPIDMLGGKKLLTLSDGKFGVTDVNGNMMFKVRGKLLSVHGKRLLVDAVGNRIVTLQKKVIALICFETYINKHTFIDLESYKKLNILKKREKLSINFTKVCIYL